MNDMIDLPCMKEEFQIYWAWQSKRLVTFMERGRPSFIGSGQLTHIYYAETSHYDVSNAAYSIDRWIGNRCTTLLCNSQDELLIEMNKIAPLHKWVCF